VPITYRAEILAKRSGEEVRLGGGVCGTSVRELAEDLIAQALLKAESLNEKDIREVTGLIQPPGQEEDASARLQAGKG
jgi:hypothetical protein